jgi:hypothetical protein
MVYRRTGTAGSSRASAIMRGVKAFASWIRGLPVLARWVTVATVLAGATGGIAGLVIGLFAYPPTAPFAAAEIAFPASFVGAVVGLVAGMTTTAAFRIRRHIASSRIPRRGS